MVVKLNNIIKLAPRLVWANTAINAMIIDVSINYTVPTGDYKTNTNYIYIAYNNIIIRIIDIIL